MSEGIVSRITGTLLLLLLINLRGFSQDVSLHRAKFMFYNVENLFDIYNDPHTDDDEFLPGGLRRWNYERYNNKINCIFKTIMAAGEYSPPELIGLCEVENRKVLNDLIYNTNLSKFNYSIIHEDSPDPRGIDVSLIYRKEAIKIFSYRYFVPPVRLGNEFKTRSVLYVKCGIFGDTVHIFLNHWPSKRGGVLAGDSQRFLIAEMIRSKSDSIALQQKKEPFIIIAGDFNSTPDDRVIRFLTDNYTSGLSLVNLSETLPGNSGTYKYKGVWQMIDQVIVSEALIDPSNGLCPGDYMLKIFRPGFLMQKDQNYPGEKPFSTYLGYKYQGGYSDHLPILLELGKK